MCGCVECCVLCCGFVFYAGVGGVGGNGCGCVFLRGSIRVVVRG